MRDITGGHAGGLVKDSGGELPAGMSIALDPVSLFAMGGASAHSEKTCLAAQSRMLRPPTAPFLYPTVPFSAWPIGYSLQS